MLSWNIKGNRADTQKRNGWGEDFVCEKLWINKYSDDEALLLNTF